MTEVLILLNIFKLILFSIIYKFPLLNIDKYFFFLSTRFISEYMMMLL